MNAPCVIHRDAGPPPPRNKCGRKSKYPFGKMDVNDAFFVDPTGRIIGRQDAAHNQIRTAATEWAKRYNPSARFEVRTVVREGVRKVGCWRVE